MAIQITTVFKTLSAACLLTTALWPQTDSAALDKVLSQMDAAAAKFHTTEARVTYDEYQKVINDTETETGRIYFRREGSEVQMAVDFDAPDVKYVRYTGGKVQVYLPKADEVDEYSPGKNRADVESYLVLGFGGSGHELLKSYDVKLLGSETVSGVKAEKLELIPKSEHFRSNFIARILLWIDPANGLSVQQQFFQPDPKNPLGGDYRLAKYSDLKIDQKLPDGVFKLKTTKKTKFVSPQ
ncbi:MAG TPA: outer membrane lipoprotein carrier protein LolA [Terriglobales bacterium]|nr:outer membrane lipoprotein carrier protein LolA [Terriglobales bacterium]